MAHVPVTVLMDEIQHIDERRCRNQRIVCLPELMNFVGNNYEKFANSMRKCISENEIEMAFGLIRSFPIVRLSVEFRGKWADPDMNSLHLNIYRGSNKVIDVHANEQYSMLVQMNRTNGKQARNKAHAPTFSKPKDESWFLVLGESINSGELLVLKRIPGFKTKASHNIFFTTPKAPGKSTLTIYFMSDCYVGLDQQIDIKLNVLPALEHQRIEYEELEYPNQHTDPVSVKSSEISETIQGDDNIAESYLGQEKNNTPKSKRDIRKNGNGRY